MTPLPSAFSQLDRRAVPAIGLALTTLLWGYNFIVMKQGLQHASPVAFATYRFGIAAISLLPVMFWLRKPLLVPRHQWLPLIALGLMLTLTFWLVMQALSVGHAGKTSILVYAMPLWVVLLSRVFLHEHLRQWQLIAIGLAIVGLIVLLDPRHSVGSWTSSLLALAGGMVWAASVVLVKIMQRRDRLPMLTLTFWQMTFGFVGFATLLALGPRGEVAWSYGFAALIGYSGILATAVASVLFYFALERMPAGLAGIGTLATPTVSILAAWIQLGERPTAAEAVGMAFIAIALIALSLVPLWFIGRQNRF